MIQQPLDTFLVVFKIELGMNSDKKLQISDLKFILFTKNYILKMYVRPTRKFTSENKHR